MTAAKIALLPDRGVVSVTGADAGKFLDGLITNDLGLLSSQGAIFAGLLSPQGKVLFDFFVMKDGDGYLLDTARDMAGDLVKRLTMYKLRASVTLEDRSANTAILALWGPSPASFIREVYPDPRCHGLGVRAHSLSQWASDDALATNGQDATADDYHAHRISLGIPEGGRDYVFGDTFPHEALFDQLHGVSFTKGCYVGQEIVARMEHRGTARRRIVRVRGEAPLPPVGTQIEAAGVTLGVMGTSAEGTGLAMLRLDRVAEFQAKGVALTAGGATIVPDPADVARLTRKAPDPIALD